MKKNISINIGGIIFHIEEDGFDKLRNYLDSINKYFSSFEGSKEIIEDIESRIAEIFLSKLNEVNQVISLVNVEEVIGTMGTTQDFDATIEAEPVSEEAASGAGDEKEPDSTESDTEKEAAKKLERDGRKKIFGGVASGIAYYFGLDPIWIRLLFIAFFVNVFSGGLSGFVLLTYILLWIVLPVNNNLEEDKKLKKLFRDKDKSVIGGVAKGLASYFGIDVAVVRLIFVLSIFLGGAGIILYLIFWIIMPVAKTLTEKMQMEGEPVTLSNIEENVKRRLNVKDDTENALTKILLFPFRLIALIIDGIGKLLGPSATGIAEVIRVFSGIIIILVGFSLMIAFVVVLLILVGWLPVWWSEYIELGSFPLELAVSSFAGFAVMSVFIVVFIPSLALTLAGTSILTKRRIGKSYWGWSLLGVWILGIIGLIFFLPHIFDDFSTEGIHREERTFPVAAGTPTLRLNDKLLKDYDAVKLKLRGHVDSLYKLELTYEARGEDRTEAKENAEAVNYVVSREASDFVFDSNLDFPPGVPYRFQEVEAVFYLPEGKKFRMEEDLSEILTHTIYRNGYRVYQMENNDWIFRKGRLTCLTCEEKRRKSTSGERPRSYGNERATFNYSDFDEVQISSFIEVVIEESDEYEVIIEGKEEHLDDIYVRQEGDKIEIKHRDREWKWWEDPVWDNDIIVYLSMPDLESLDVSGACKAKVNGFNNGEIDISLKGASELDAGISPEYLNLQLFGASNVYLRGSAEKFDVRIVGASKIDALDFRTSYADIEARGAAEVRVFVTEELSADAAGISTIKYKGNPIVNSDENGLSSVERY